MKTLFITGSSGFIGRHLIEKINPKAFDRIFCLSRTGELPSLDVSSHPNIRVIKGDLFDADSYAEFLSSSDIVLHLAAVTGKAKPEEYFDINARGTEYLLEQCKKSGVKQFLFISSIAVKFRDVSQYYYALSKQQGEDAVRSSGLNYTIVRPTIVIGKESAIWRSLSQLSKAPITLMFGDGKAKIQPIYIDDLNDCILSIIKKNIFLNEALDLGGPEEITIEDFLKQIHQTLNNKDPRIIHIPLSLLIPTLSFLEKYFYSFLPLTVGQLSSFRYDGTIEDNRLLRDHLPKMKDVKEMVSEVITQEKEEIRRSDLIEECEVFCPYLVKQKPSAYVREKYISGHRKLRIGLANNAISFDKLIIDIAQINHFFTKLADTYTRIFLRFSFFRKKLVMLLAILESCPPYHSYLDAVDSGCRIMLYLRIFRRGLSFTILSLFSAILFLPLHLGFMIVSKMRHRS